LPKVVCKTCDCEFDVADEASEGTPIMCLSCNEEGVLRKIGEGWELEIHEE
jgi:hypothetical protein